MGVSAFPHPEMEVHGSFGDAGAISALAQVGLTKRELFAAIAMHGLLGHINLYTGRNTGELMQFCLEASIEVADGLLTELEK